MADEPAAEAPAAPVDQTPAAPAPETPAAPIAAQAEIAAPAAAEPAATPATAEPAKDAPVQPERSLLSQALDAKKDPTAEGQDKKEPPKAEPPAEAKPPDHSPGAEPINWEYSIPDTVKLDDKGRERVNGMFDAFAANPRDQKAQQALVDYHVEKMAELAQQTADFNRTFWADTRHGWRERWASDPEIGGSGFEITKAAAIRILDIAMRHNDRSAANVAFHRDVEEMLETTGVGDHPAFGRILIRLARFLDESPPAPADIKPAPDAGKNPRQSGRIHYNSMGG